MSINLEEINKQIQELDLPPRQKDAVLKLISIKTSSDMEKPILAIGGFKNELTTKSDSLKNVFHTRIESLKGEIKLVSWIIGVIMGAITLLLAIIAMKS